MVKGQRFDPGPAIVEVPVQTQGCVIIEFGPENNAGRAGFAEALPVNLPGALLSLPDWSMFIQSEWQAACHGMVSSWFVLVISSFKIGFL